MHKDKTYMVCAATLVLLPANMVMWLTSVVSGNVFAWTQLCIYACTHVCVSGVFRCLGVVCMHVCVCACVRACVHVIVYVCVCTYVCVSMYVCKGACMC